MSSLYFINLPTVGADGFEYYIESIGTGYSNVTFTTNTAPIAMWDGTQYTLWNQYNTDRLLGYTYKIKYCLTSGNPYPAISYPSYYIERIGSQLIPLKDNKDIYVIITSNYNTITGGIGLPNMLNGKTFRIHDYNGYMATTNLTLFTTNNNTINSQSYESITSNKFYMYYGSGDTNGNVISL